VKMVAEARAAAAPPIDELLKREEQKPSVVAKRKVLVRLEGASEPDTNVEMFDAATGKVIAKGLAKDPELTLNVTARAAQVLYAVATRKGAKYRSGPFQMVADRGAVLAIYIYPRLLPSFQFAAFADDDVIAVRAGITVANNSWSPYADATHGPVIALPRGAKNIAIDHDAAAATIKGTDLHITKPLPPGPFELDVTFDLPANQGQINWSLDLPYGSFSSSFYMDKESGLTIDHLPAGVSLVTKAVRNQDYLVVEDITLPPNQAMQMQIHLPKPRPETTLRHACRRLQPDDSPLVGKPIDFTLMRLDGKQLKLSSLRGKPMLVNVMATWDMLSKKERPTLATLAKTAGITIVMVASDRDPKEVASIVGKPPFAVVLDPPPTADDNIGTVTTSWGINLVPENLLVDAKGIVRYHFQNARAWDTPEALRCVKAFMAAK
jgi:thiol-disulfide isomerase/thioredoxin